MEMTLGWTKDETKVNVGESGSTKTKNLCADFKRVSADERKREIQNFLGTL